MTKSKNKNTRSTSKRFIIVILKSIMWFFIVFFSLLFLYFLAYFILARITVEGEKKSNPTIVVYLMNSGVHTDFVLPVENEDGTVSMLRSCIDGPVMDGSKVQWSLVGKQL